MGVVEKWCPLPVGQEVEQRDGTEEEDRFPDQDRHDGDRREYRNQCGQQQQALDAAFSEVAAPLDRPYPDPVVGGRVDPLL
jgi:hypothetical protein